MRSSGCSDTRPRISRANHCRGSCPSAPGTAIGRPSSDTSKSEFEAGDERLFTGIIHDVTARKERERALPTHQGFRATVEDALTDRQLEILQTAYYSGYFESPRDSTGEAVAAALDISQPTFATHLRTTHRKILNLLFDEQPPA